MRLALIALSVFLAAASAAAQSLAPMREDFATYSDRFAIRLTARNPYDVAKRFAVSVYEADWSPSTAYSVTPSLLIAPGETRGLLVLGENRKEAERTLFVCVTSEPFAARGGAAVKGEVCGKYRILQRAL